MGELTDRVDRLLAQKGGAMLSDHRRVLAREIVEELGKPSLAMVAAIAPLFPSDSEPFAFAELLRAAVAAELRDPPVVASPLLGEPHLGAQLSFGDIRSRPRDLPRR